jgi:hypothetical protein
MINHARTLLLNQARRKTHYSDIGYEYVPPEFRPVTLTPTLQLVRQLLFGSTPDNYFLNYRCRELLSYVHATELEEYIYRFDPRVTYWPETHKPFFEPTSKRVVINQTYGTPYRFNVTGSLQSLNSLGHANRQYTIDLFKTNIGGEVVMQLKLQRVGSRAAPIVETVQSFDSTPVLVLPETDIKLRLTLRAPILGETLLASERDNNFQIETYSEGFNSFLTTEPFGLRRITSDNDALTLIEVYSASSVAAETDTGLIARWFVETKATPEPILTSAIAGLELIGEPASIELFGFKNEEPYLTFKNLWFDHPLPVYRLNGMVLALIYRTEELRGR